MKLVFLILLCIVFCSIEFFLFVILPPKQNRIFISISLFLLFLLVLFVGIFGIYKLGKIWNMESYVKIFLGICCVFLIFSSFIYDHIKK